MHITRVGMKKRAFTFGFIVSILLLSYLKRCNKIAKPRKLLDYRESTHAILSVTFLIICVARPYNKFVYSVLEHYYHSQSIDGPLGE